MEEFCGPCVSGFNKSKFNTDQFDGGVRGPAPVFPGTGPYNYPQITTGEPLAAPPQPLTNVGTVLESEIAGVIISWNGLSLTEGADFTRRGPLITLIAPPGPGDVLTAQVFNLGKQLGGATPKRYVAPVAYPVAGALDGKSTAYQIQIGPTIFGALDGINKLFTFGVPFRRIQLWRNGVLQTIGLDYTSGPTAIVFMPLSIPIPGDFLLINGWS